MVKIPDWHNHRSQVYSVDNKEWSVSRLIELSKELTVFEADINSLYLGYAYDLSLLSMIMHFKAMQAADLSFPIILDETGIILDGRHRLMKAIFENKSTIKAVRFDENPSPCRIIE